MRVCRGGVGDDRDATGKLEGERPKEGGRQGGIEGGDCEREVPWTRGDAAVCAREREREGRAQTEG